MTEILKYFFFFNTLLFVYIFAYGIIFNVLLLQNKSIIEMYVKKHGYKLYVYENIDGKTLSRRERLKMLKEMLDNNIQIKNRDFLMVILRMYNFTCIIFGISFFSFIFLFIATIVANGRKWMRLWHIKYGEEM